MEIKEFSRLCEKLIKSIELINEKNEVVDKILLKSLVNVWVDYLNEYYATHLQDKYNTEKISTLLYVKCLINHCLAENLDFKKIEKYFDKIVNSNIDKLLIGCNYDKDVLEILLRTLLVISNLYQIRVALLNNIEKIKKARFYKEKIFAFYKELTESM